MELLVLVYLFAVLSGHVALCGSPICTYNATTPSEYVTCFDIKQRPPYACDSNGGAAPGDDYQIHILETDLQKFEEDSEPEVFVSVKPMDSLNISKPIVLVFHSFRRVRWRVHSDIFPSGTRFIIRSSHPLIIDPPSALARSPVNLLQTLPNDSEDVIMTVESLYQQRITSFSGFHEGSKLVWNIGTGKSINAPCKIHGPTITERLQIFKESQVRTSGCSVPLELGYSKHIIDLDKTQDTDFAFAKHAATVLVRSKGSGEEYYGSNVFLVLRSKKLVEWTIDTSAMDGSVLVVTNGEVPNWQSNSNLDVQTNTDIFPQDLGRQEFIEYVTDHYGEVSSYTHVEIANRVIIEVPEARIDPPTGNTTPITDASPNPEELVASFDGQKTVNCYREKVVVSWPMSLLQNLQVRDVSFSEGSEPQCGMTKMQSEVALLSGYAECGFKAQKERFSTLYTAGINVTLLNGRKRKIDIQCRIYNTTGLEAVAKSSLYQLLIYEDSEFRNQISTSAVPYNGYVYFKADLNEISDPNMSAVVEECFLSPNKDNILDRHVLISRSCPLDGSIKFLNRNYADEKSQKIKFKMSQWFLNTNHYYLHCKMSMCSSLVTPDIPQCSSVVQLCKRDPAPEEAGEGGVSMEEYLLAGPISVQNYTTVLDNSTTAEEGHGDTVDCETIAHDAAPGVQISIGLVIGISLGSFALGIILTVLTIHCVSRGAASGTSPASPTDVFHLQNRQSSLYESIKIYNEYSDVCPQGRHLNRTSNPDLSSGI